MPEKIKHKIFENSLQSLPESVFLVLLGMSSFPPKQVVHEKTTENLVPSRERARNSSMTKNKAI